MSSVTQIQALAGGAVQLPALNQITGSVTLESNGSGSTLTGATGQVDSDCHSQRDQHRGQWRS